MSRIREQYDLTGDNTAAVATGPAAHRRDHHQRRAAADRRDRGVLAVGDHVHQDDRRRDAHRDRDRRDDRADPAGARPRCGCWAGRTGTRPARCAGSTRATASGSPTATATPEPAGPGARRHALTDRGQLTGGGHLLAGRAAAARCGTGAPAGCRRRSGGARRDAARGSRDGGRSLPQPTQYRPRCSMALQCVHVMVPPPTGSEPTRSAQDGRSTTGRNGAAGPMGRAVTGPRCPRPALDLCPRVRHGGTP